MKIVYQGQTIDLDNKQPLGAGGEAVVIKYGELAFKIYHAPSKERAEKLKAFMASNFSLPDNVACPLDMVKNTSGKVIGFAMKAAKGCRDFVRLSNRKFRVSEQISANDIMSVFAHAKQTLDEIHKKDIVIGDLNDMNILFNSKMLAVFIDVDSYQFGGFPCPVGTELFLDPDLYGINLSEKPYFSIQTDWYSFAVMLFRSLLFVYPYGGIHKTIKNTFERIVQKITVFDSDVIYPKIGLPPETISDDLLDYFDTVFKKGKRIDLTAAELEKYKGEFVPCPACGIYFFKERKKCPACCKVTPEPAVDLTQIIVKKQIDKAVCTKEELFSSDGVILFVKVFAQRIVVIDYDFHHTYLHIIDSKAHKKVKLWDNHLKGLAYDFFANHLLVASGNDLMIFTIGSNAALPAVKTTTLCFDNESVIGASGDYMYRLTTTDLIKGKMSGNTPVESTVLSIMENQTWFAVSQNDTGLGFFRIFEKFHYFIFSSKGRFELGLKPLEGRTIEHEVLFSHSHACLLRKNLHDGRTYSHVHIADLTGVIRYEHSEPSLSSDVYKTITGKALSGGHLIHPTDAGIVIEKQGALSLKSATAEFVNSASQLYLYKDGIVTVNDRQILFLRMG
jgi:serine/threonine protein kinase